MWVFLAARARRAWQCEPQELYNTKTRTGSSGAGIPPKE